MKNTIIGLVIVLVLAAGGYYAWKSMQGGNLSVTNPAPAPAPETVTPPSTAPPPVATSTTANKDQEVLGKSVEGRDIVAYHFGSGSKEILFVAGAHGGYEWNTTLLAYQLIDFLKQNPAAISSGERVTVIPTLNPDGLYKVTGKEGRFTADDVSSDNSVVVSGRYNANAVDLNRNFDCDWQATGMWQNTQVSGGANAFSEPESQAFKTYVGNNTPAAVVEFFSAAGGVFSSSCGGDVLPETSAITKIYADASGYPSFKEYDFYDLTGDMVNWLAKESIPAISVLLTDHVGTEWTKNKAGITAILAHYGQ